MAAPVDVVLAAGSVLTRDVRAGEAISLADVTQPSESMAWDLRTGDPSIS